MGAYYVHYLPWFEICTNKMHMKHINITDKKAGKFKEWLKIGSHSELKPNQELIEVLSYLAFETVREVSRKVVKYWNQSE